MRKFIFVPAIAMLLASQTTSFAGVVFSQLAVLGVPNTFKDNSVSQLTYDANGDGKVDVGDVIQGIIRFDERTDPNPNEGVNFDETTQLGDQLVIVFSAQVGSISGITYTLVPTTVAGQGLDTMLPAQFGVAGAVPLSAGQLSQTIFAVLDGTNLPKPTEVSLATALGQLDVTGDYFVDLVGGIVNADDFFLAKLDDSDIDAARAFALAFPDAAQIVIGSEVGGFTEIVNQTGYSFAETTLVKKTLLDKGSLHQFGLNGTLYTPTNGQAKNGYQVNDSTNVTFTPSGVPEPGSLLVWASLGCLAAFRGMRRKTTTVA